MELKRLITKVSYRIEPKPEGGFIARTSDPTDPPLEAPTREELVLQIQGKIAAAVNTEFPGLKLPTDSKKIALHIGKTLNAQFTPTSAKLEWEPNAGNSVESGRKEKESVRFGPPSQGTRSNYAIPETTHAAWKSSGVIVSNSPIVPESSGWGLIRILLPALAILGLLYSFFHR